MTPERIEEINGLMRNVKQGNLALRDNGISIISELLTALEESQQQLTKREDMLRESLNITRRLENRLAEAQQTIAQMRKGTNQ